MDGSNDGSHSPPLNLHFSRHNQHKYASFIAPPRNDHRLHPSIRSPPLNAMYRGTPYDRHPPDEHLLQPYHLNGSLNLMRRNSEPVTALLHRRPLDLVTNGHIENVDAIEVDEDDMKPLDFSNKKNRSSSESQTAPAAGSQSPNAINYHRYYSSVDVFSHPRHEFHPQQMMRPSVITCASTLSRSQHSLSPSCQSCNGNNSNSDSKISDDSSDSFDAVDGKRRGSRRLEDVSEMSDPVIDEHFRRSLGKDYSEIFAENNSSPTITSMTGNYTLLILISYNHGAITLPKSHYQTNVKLSSI